MAFQRVLPCYQNCVKVTNWISEIYNKVVHEDSSQKHRRSTGSNHRVSEWFLAWPGCSDWKRKYASQHSACQIATRSQYPHLSQPWLMRVLLLTQQSCAEPLAWLSRTVRSSGQESGGCGPWPPAWRRCDFRVKSEKPHPPPFVRHTQRPTASWLEQQHQHFHY